MTDDWASKAVGRFKQEQGVEQQKEERAAQKCRILEEQGSSVWTHVRQLLQAEIADFNQKVGKEVLIAPVTNNQKLVIFAKTDSGQRELQVIFDSQSYSISGRAGASPQTNQAIDYEQTFQMAVSTANTISFPLSGGFEQSPQYIVDTMLNRLMGWK